MRLGRTAVAVQCRPEVAAARGRLPAHIDVSAAPQRRGLLISRSRAGRASLASRASRAAPLRQTAGRAGRRAAEGERASRLSGRECSNPTPPPIKRVLLFFIFTYFQYFFLIFFFLRKPLDTVPLRGKGGKGQKAVRVKVTPPPPKRPPRPRLRSAHGYPKALRSRHKNPRPERDAARATCGLAGLARRGRGMGPRRATQGYVMILPRPVLWRRLLANNNCPENRKARKKDGRGWSEFARGEAPARYHAGRWSVAQRGR